VTVVITETSSQDAATLRQSPMTVMWKALFCD
jgi:hypothetical protein